MRCPMSPLQVRQVWSCSKEQLVRRLGKAAGQNLWNHAHGRDDRPVEPPGKRKSVGAEVNWGIRFTCDADCTEVLEGIAAEVGRLAGAMCLRDVCTLAAGVQPVQAWRLLQLVDRCDREVVVQAEQRPSDSEAPGACWQMVGSIGTVQRRSSKRRPPAPQAAAVPCTAC